MNAPTAMNAAVPSDSWPAYPVRMFRPSVASAKMRNGVRIADSQYWLAISGTTTNATASSSAKAMRSWRIGKICWSCGVGGLELSGFAVEHRYTLSMIFSPNSPCGRTSRNSSAMT